MDNQFPKQKPTSVVLDRWRCLDIVVTRLGGPSGEYEVVWRKMIVGVPVIERDCTGYIASSLEYIATSRSKMGGDLLRRRETSGSPGRRPDHPPSCQGREMITLGLRLVLLVVDDDDDQWAADRGAIVGHDDQTSSRDRHSI
ncbi:hypothetical protein PG997_013992 [Apiospora hydei]|uniref:Uncharacterized protein n=1 Tax=Apiospora hydei TaxID=1337664 RepID=A0ABR1V7S9_9PEZI